MFPILDELLNIYKGTEELVFLEMDDLPHEMTMVRAEVFSYTVEGEPETWWGYEIYTEMGGDDPGNSTLESSEFETKEEAMRAVRDALIKDLLLPKDKVVGHGDD